MRADDEAQLVDVDGLEVLFAVLRGRGYTIVGPAVRDGAVMLSELTSPDQLPRGWAADTEAGRYRLRRRTDDAIFAHCAGPQSAKDFLHPPRARLWSADSAPDDDVTTTGPAPADKRYAFVGLHPCDVAAINVLDRVLARGRYPDPVYTSRRDGTFIVVAECTEPAATCFCTSTATGPGAAGGFDLSLTELLTGGHRFVVRSGSPAGADVLAEVPSRPAGADLVASAAEAVDRAAAAINRRLPGQPLPALFAAGRESPVWDDVASRCLTCGNCTMVCPTCFCTTTEDVTDLSGEHAERWRRWDSCFDIDFSYVHGGPVRASAKSRYRQWISHKLGTWPEQFGVPGCVGCGRCIAWCPAGIDITREAAALAAAEVGGEP
ncbi:4Fe-4S dicluster domain-containing protein [Paractinoplanes brasiliensis]|uniref:4Fe-4S dicluster protein n=1 Tax=Paractinoplanes brasiliensis TaxID=52695 RepID=A0A4R6JLZ8_9ACTN|nr:4Fe-4S dicluster domain-containing protein [Actinoplanes brasiliensis]TDO36732.1 4Fe-4S dicluster protein [Actinoplanes brasiliensis]GID32370.1 4Fe-4S ferredoxin [Actinoplanes brasiliensis]